MTASNKAKTTTEDDWFGELLVGLVALTGKGLFRFALRWPDTATLLTIFAITGMLAGLRVACLLTAVCAAGVWGWRLGWPDSYERLIGKPVADYRRAYLVYRRRWRTICEHHNLTIAQRGKPDADPLVPLLASVRIGAAVDTLVVRLLVGQSVKTWAAQVDGLAAAFGAHNVTVEPGRVEAGRGRDIVLRVRHHDALAAPIPLARPCPDTPVVRLAQRAGGGHRAGQPVVAAGGRPPHPGRWGHRGRQRLGAVVAGGRAGAGHQSGADRGALPRSQGRYGIRRRASLVRPLRS